MNIAFVHVPILNINEIDKIEIAGQLREDIESAEEKLENKNTIVIGDFNMNPFDKGMYCASGLHAIPYAEEAKKKKRMLRKKERYYFYNPTWNLMGDSTEPYGSFYYQIANNECLFWHHTDQLLIRPELIQDFEITKLRLITKTNSYQLLKNKKPNVIISDHLPIFCEI